MRAAYVLVHESAMLSPDFTLQSVLLAVAGGGLIGLASSLLLLLNGQIAGISGIVGRVVDGPADDTPRAQSDGWRIAFIAGLLIAGAILMVVSPTLVETSASRSLGVTALAGLVVGFGVRMGSGCTSGHGVCGVSRVSPRSLVATGTFMATGFVTATGITLLFGGSL